MRYFLIYRNGCNKDWKCDRELTRDGFVAHLRNFAYGVVWKFGDACGIPVDDRPIDEMEMEADYIAEKLYNVSTREGGVRLGDFHLYMRDDDTSIYDIERPGKKVTA